MRKQDKSSIASIKLQCPGCGSEFSVSDRLRGQLVNCPRCNLPIRVEVPEVGGAPRPLPLHLSTEDDSSFKTCPHCGAQVGRDVVICYNCGYNFKTKRAYHAGGLLRRLFGKK